MHSTHATGRTAQAPITTAATAPHAPTPEQAWLAIADCFDSTQQDAAKQALLTFLDPTQDDSTRTRAFLHLRALSPVSHQECFEVSPGPGGRGLTCKLSSRQTLLPLVSHTLEATDLQGVNLAGLDLTGIHWAGVNLAGANLQGTILQHANLKKANLAGANLEKADLKEANLKKANLAGANLKKADLNWANLTKADLSMANLEEATLKSARLMGAILRQANLKKCDFSSTLLDDADFCGANMEESKLNQAWANGANMTNTNLKKSQLCDTQLSQTNFSNADLSEATMTNANMPSADLTGAKLQKAIMLQASLPWSCLKGADLQAAQMRQANLYNANIRWANLKEANFSWANLRNTNLRGTNTENTLFDGAKLEGARWYGLPTCSYSSFMPKPELPATPLAAEHHTALMVTQSSEEAAPMQLQQSDQPVTTCPITQEPFTKEDQVCLVHDLTDPTLVTLYDSSALQEWVDKIEDSGTRATSPITRGPLSDDLCVHPDDVTYYQWTADGHMRLDNEKWTRQGGRVVARQTPPPTP